MRRMSWLNGIMALLSLLQLYSSVKDVRCAMILPRSDCFKSLPGSTAAIAIATTTSTTTATTTALTSAQSSEELSTKCASPGSILCPEEMISESVRNRRFAWKPSRETVYFVADDTNSCIYWRCLTSLTAIQMRCAPGSKLAQTYIGGSGNPCTIRYFGLAEKECPRKSNKTVDTTTTTASTVTPIRPTLEGGIILPTEITGPVTRPPLTTLIHSLTSHKPRGSGEASKDGRKQASSARGLPPKSATNLPSTTVRTALARSTQAAVTTITPPDVLDLRVEGIPGIHSGNKNGSSKLVRRFQPIVATEALAWRSNRQSNTAGKVQTSAKTGRRKGTSSSLV